MKRQFLFADFQIFSDCGSTKCGTIGSIMEAKYLLTPTSLDECIMLLINVTQIYIIKVNKWVKKLFEGDINII